MAEIAEGGVSRLSAPLLQKQIGPNLSTEPDFQGGDKSDAPASLHALLRDVHEEVNQLVAVAPLLWCLHPSVLGGRVAQGIVNSRRGHLRAADLLQIHARRYAAARGWKEVVQSR